MRLFLITTSRPNSAIRVDPALTFHILRLYNGAVDFIPKSLPPVIGIYALMSPPVTLIFDASDAIFNPPASARVVGVPMCNSPSDIWNVDVVEGKSNLAYPLEIASTVPVIVGVWFQPVVPT